MAENESRAFFGFRLTPTRAAVSHHKVFTHGVSCAFIRNQKFSSFCFEPRRDGFTDGFKDATVSKTYTVKRHRSNTEVPVEFAFFVKKWKESRARFALDAFVKRARFYTRVDTRRVAS